MLINNNNNIHRRKTRFFIQNRIYDQPDEIENSNIHETIQHITNEYKIDVVLYRIATDSWFLLYKEDIPGLAMYDSCGVKRYSDRFQMHYICFDMNKYLYEM